MNFRTSLVVLAKDSNRYPSSAVDIWFDDTDEIIKNGCILSDLNKNIHIFLLNEVESNNSIIIIMINVEFKWNLTEVSDIYLGKKVVELKSPHNKTFIYYAADDGSIGFFKSISKLTYSRLVALCDYLYDNLPFKAGMNPKDFFNCKYLDRKSKRGIVDMRILDL